MNPNQKDTNITPPSKSENLPKTETPQQATPVQKTDNK